MSTDVYARHPRKGRTARELATLAGRSVRTAQRWTSEPRELYEARASERHAHIRELRAEDKSYRTIAAELNISYGAVQYALGKSENVS